ncbi:hypothetical protein BS17DRAFT_782976 [Gyrodon lividus]|nr:hypothetical protein BS17DRAFT_782976 [Gyrodon lividus]
MTEDNQDRNTKVRDGKNAESLGWEVQGLECLMEEKLSKVKSEARDSGFGHRGSELGWMG